MRDTAIEIWPMCDVCLDKGTVTFLNHGCVCVYIYIYGTAPLLNIISISEYKDFAGIRLGCIKSKMVRYRWLVVVLRVCHADWFTDVRAEGAIPGGAQHQRAGPACPAVHHSHVPQAEQGQLQVEGGGGHQRQALAHHLLWGWWRWEGRGGCRL